jgi:hypothetical protein
MWRNIFRPAPAVAVGALLLLAGCGGGDQATSAGAQATASSTTSTTRPATTTSIAPTTTTAPACANVSFSSNADDRASEIKATGLSCADAEALVRKVGPQVVGDGGPSRVDSDGFVCNRTSARSGDHGPASAIFECINGPSKVVFTRT